MFTTDGKDAYRIKSGRPPASYIISGSNLRYLCNLWLERSGPRKHKITWIAGSDPIGSPRNGSWKVTRKRDLKWERVRAPARENAKAGNFAEFMSTLQEIEAAVLRLSDKDRLQLTDKLLSSLPEPSAPGTPEEILSEAVRRDAEIDSGNVPPLSETEFWEGVRRRG